AAVLLGLSAGIPFGPVVHAAATIRPDAPGAAVGVVNTFGNGATVVGVPLLGLAFSFASGGPIRFAVGAALSADGALADPSGGWAGRRDSERVFVEGGGQILRPEEWQPYA